MRFRRFTLLVAAVLSLSAAPVFAAPAKPIPPATPDGVTHHTLVLGGRRLSYTARAGTITLRDGDEQPTARVFYTAFTLDGADPSHRAVTFLYNGGPGSSTIWLRMGSFGPVRVQTANGSPTGPPPYRIVDNQYSLLDKTDLVFIDMPGSGFGRFIGNGQPKDFWGVDEDVAAFGQFIQRYITTFGRWNSPTVPLRRIVRNDAVGGALELPSGPRRRPQRHRSALVVPQFEPRLQRRRAERRRRLGIRAQSADGDRDRMVPSGASGFAAAERLASRGGELRAKRISRRIGAGRADFGRTLQRHRIEAAPVHRVVGAVHSQFEPADSVRPVLERTRSRSRPCVRTARLAIPVVRARPPGELRGLGSHRSRHRLGVYFQRQRIHAPHAGL